MWCADGFEEKKRSGNMKEIRERRKIIVEKQDNFGYEIEKEILAMNGELKKRKRSKL